MIQDIGISKEGEVYVTYYHAGREKITLAKINTSSYRLEDNVEILGSGWLFPGVSNGFLIYDENFLYEYSPQTGECNVLLNWTEHYINSATICAINMKEDKSINLITTNEQTMELVSLKEKRLAQELADVGNENKKIVLLYTDYDSYLQGLIVEFNKQSDKYMVELETVDDTYSFNDTVTYVNSRLVSQNSPDLILSSYTFYEMYMEDKVLEDLMPYLESSSELNVKDYRESVIEPFKKGDAFGILQFCLKYGMNRFVDYENGTCEFDGEEFKDLLMRIDALERQNSSHNHKWSTVVKEGQKIIAEIHISNFEFYPQMEVEYGDKINFIGYPTTDGDLKCQLTPGSIMGILTKSKHKEGAWEFYEYYMNNYPVRWGFSANVEIFQQDLQKAMEKKFMKNDDGEQLELPISYTYPDNEPVYAMTKEQADKILTAIEAAEPFQEEKRTLMDIVTSEAVSFFYGNKTLDEVTKLIQNRVQLYLNENM